MTPLPPRRTGLNRLKNLVVEIWLFRNTQNLFCSWISKNFKISRWQCKQTKWRCKQTIWQPKKFKLRKWIKSETYLFQFFIFSCFFSKRLAQFISLYFLASYNHIFFFSKGKIHVDAQASIQLITSLLLYVLDLSLILTMPHKICIQVSKLVS